MRRKLRNDKSRVHISESSKIPGNPSARTVRRWIKTGLKNKRTGEMIRLESQPLGGRRWTSLEAIERFNNALE